MDRVSVTFQVFFSAPFWIGIVNRVTGQKQETARMVFGAEPKDYEVQESLLKKQKSREQKELENRLQFERKQQKRKDKHRGR